MRIRAANAPVSWGIMEVEGWSPPISSSRVLDEIAAAGYDGTELGPYGFLPTTAGLLGDELRRCGLALTSAFVPLRLKEPRADLEPLRQVARLLSALGARYIVLADAMWPEREALAGRVAGAGVALSDGEWSRVHENVNAAIETAAGFGLRCVFHHHAGSYIETPEEVERLLAGAGIALCLDTGHYVFGGGDPVDAVRRFGARVEYLHFKDIDPSRIGDGGFLNAVRNGAFRPLGQGVVRFPALLEELARIGYDGWAVVEQDIDAAQAAAGAGLESAAASRKFLKEVLGI
jgi:inosose dehydratase